MATAVNWVAKMSDMGEGYGCGPGRAEVLPLSAAAELGCRDVGPGAGFDVRRTERRGGGCGERGVHLGDSGPAGGQLVSVDRGRGQACEDRPG